MIKPTVPVLILLTAISTATFADPKLLWENPTTFVNENSASNIHGRQMVLDSAGNTYVVTYSSVPVRFSEGFTSAGKGLSTSILKYAPNGKLVMFKSFADIWGWSIALGPQGEIGIVGQNKNTSPLVLSPSVTLAPSPKNVEADGCIIIMTAKGEIKWAKSVHREADRNVLNQHPKGHYANALIDSDLHWTSIAFDHEGYVIVGGHHYLFNDLGNGIWTDKDQSDPEGWSGIAKAIIAKYSPDGTPLWIQTALPLTGATSYIQTGTGDNRVNFTPVDPKMPRGGIINHSEIDQIVIDNDNNIYVTGYFQGNGALRLDKDGPKVTGKADVKEFPNGYGRIPEYRTDKDYSTAIVAKLNPNGKVQWMYQPTEFPTGFLATDVSNPDRITYVRVDSKGPETLVLNGKGEEIERTTGRQFEVDPNLIRTDNTKDYTNGNYTYVLIDQKLAPDGSIVAMAEIWTKKDIALSPKMKLKGHGPGIHLTVFKYKP